MTACSDGVLCFYRTPSLQPALYTLRISYLAQMSFICCLDPIVWVGVHGLGTVHLTWKGIQHLGHICLKTPAVPSDRMGGWPRERWTHNSGLGHTK